MGVLSLTVGLLWLSAAAITAGGGMLVWWGLLADRSSGVPRCPRCWYNMTGAPNLRCPECGHAARRARDLHHTRRRWAAALPGALLALAPPLAWVGARNQQALLRRVLPPWKTCERLELGRFVVVRSRARWDDDPAARARVRVWYGSQLALTMTGYSLDVGAGGDAGTVGRGDDLNGDGVPDLLIAEFTGGAHCCSVYHFFTLDDDVGLRPLSTIDAGHGLLEFADLDGDGVRELKTQDWTFAYWNTSFAGSPAPDVVLRWRGNRCVVAPDLMQRPPPDVAWFAERVQLTLAGEESASTWRHGGVPASYWATMLDLIYSGHAALAARFADEAWSDVRPPADKAAFLAQFRAQLARSPYFPLVADRASP